MNKIEGQYQPTSQDLLRIKPTPDKLKVSGDGVFATMQGEGKTSGSPSVFIRLHFCNLTCGVPTGWKCDTAYTWDRTQPEFWQEPQDWSMDETVLKINQAWDAAFASVPIKRLVVTGGEPLMQQQKVAELLRELPEWHVEIETNGTIMPIQDLETAQFNCSPKLGNSGNSLRKRYRPNVLMAINQLNSQFKFVVVNASDLVEVEKIVQECELSPEKILIMPEGHTKESVDRHAQALMSEVNKKGWNVTMRNQLVWYGSTRRT